MLFLLYLLCFIYFYAIICNGYYDFCDVVVAAISPSVMLYLALFHFLKTGLLDSYPALEIWVTLLFLWFKKFHGLSHTSFERKL